MNGFTFFIDLIMIESGRQLPDFEIAGKRMKSIKRRLLLLFVVFVAAVAVYMGLEMRKTKTNDTVYTGIEEATFPLVWAQTAGREMNVMYPYTSQVGINAFLIV